MSMEKEKLDQLAKQVEELLARLPKDYTQRLEKTEKMLSEFVAFFANWIYIAVQVDREKYVSIIGKEKFEELTRAIADFVTKVSELKMT